MEKSIKSLFDVCWENKYLLLIAAGLTIFGASYSTGFDNVYWKFVVLIFGLSIIPILATSFFKTENVVFVTIVMMGSFFVIFSPVFDVLDEPAHFGRAVYISEGNFKLQNDNDKLQISKDYDKLNKMTGYNGINRLDPKKNFFHTKLFSMKTDKNKQSETKIKATRPYSTVMYLPSAFGIWLGKVLSNGNLGVMFYLGRFFNLLMYAIMAFFAVKMAGKWKMIIAVFSIQHLPVYIAASFSQDAFFYGLCLLIAAKFIQLFDKKEAITYKDVAVAGVLCGLMAFTKLPYIMLIGLMLFIPIKRYESKKVYLSNFIAIVLIIAVGLLWTKYYSTLEPTDLPGSVDQSKQISHIISHPKAFLQSMLIGGTNTVLLLKQYFTFGWSYHVSDIAYALYLMFIGSVVFMYPRRLVNKINPFFKLAIIGVSLGIILLTNFIMYLTFTGVGEPIIKGVQGRYFFGIFIMLTFILNLSEKIFAVDDLSKQTYFNEKVYDKTVLFISILFLIWMATLRVGAYY